MTAENQAVSANESRQHDMNCTFGPFLEVLQQNANLLVSTAAAAEAGRGIVLARSRVKGKEIYKLFLDSFSTEVLRKEHTCSCCRTFFERYGNLLIVLKGGTTRTLLFTTAPNIPDNYRAFTDAAAARLDGTQADWTVFADGEDGHISLNKDTATKGGFQHFSFELSPIRLKPNSYHKANEQAAEVREDVRLLGLSLERWNMEILRTARTLFEHHPDLSRTSFKDVVEDFIDLKELLRTDTSVRRANVLLRTVLDSRKGLSRIGQTVVGEFLDNLDPQRESNDVAVRKFLSMINPKDYLRPKAAPASQTVAQAEKIVAELGLTASLRRRAATRAELYAIAQPILWRTPAAAEAVAEEGAGVFGAVKTKDQVAQSVVSVVNGGTVSLRSLLEKIEQAGNTLLKLESYTAGNTKRYLSITTEAVAGVKPILLWDREESRNPFAPYTYVNPTHPSIWDQKFNDYNEVEAIIPTPTNWTGETIKPEHWMFVMSHGYDACEPLHVPLFPAQLIQELHGVRSVIEAYGKTALLEEPKNGMVAMQWCGEPLRFRLTFTDAIVTYDVSVS